MIINITLLFLRFCAPKISVSGASTSSAPPPKTTSDYFMSICQIMKSQLDIFIWLLSI